MRRPSTLNLLGYLTGLAGLVVFVRMLTTLDVAQVAQTLPLDVLWVVPLIAVPIFCGTISWGYAFPRENGGAVRRPGLGDLFTIRLAGEAINNALASAYVAGEPVKGLLAARHGSNATTGLASALIGKTTFIFGEVVFLFFGVGIAALTFGAGSQLVTMLASVTAGGLSIVALAVLVQRRRILFRSAKALQSLKLGGARLWDSALPRAEAIDEAVDGYYAKQRRDLILSVGWSALGWLLGAVELWIFLRLTSDVEQALLFAIVLEAGVAVTKGLSFFVPGSIGVQEGGIAWLFQVTGLGAEAGVVYAVLRRVRELVWIGLGFALLWWHLNRRGS